MKKETRLTSIRMIARRGITGLQVAAIVSLLAAPVNVFAEPSAGGGGANLVYLVSHIGVIGCVAWIAIRHYRKGTCPLWKIILIWGVVCFAILFLLNFGLALGMVIYHGRTM